MSGEDFEPVRGLPAPLPDGERILWQGSPEWRALALRAFHGRTIAAYFAAFAAVRLGYGALGGESLAIAATHTLVLLPFAAAALGLIALFAVLTARAAIYTVTNRRVVLRIGIALSISLNLPLGAIQSAGVRVHGDGTGDITLGLGAKQRIAFLQLWPHARPWRISRPEPMLRGVAHPERVAAILAEALSPGAAARIAQARTADARPDVHPTAALAS